MNILGISCFYHDASACLLQDGRIVAAVEEERFTRQKHATEFPKNAIAYCLREGGITVKDLDYVGFYEKPFIKFERIILSHLATFPRSWRAFLSAMPLWLREKLQVPVIIRQELGYRGPILFIEHHLAHAASAFLVSPFEEAAILTVDGVGEWATTTLGVGRGSGISLHKEIRFPHSLGLLYSAITAYLGFKINSGEGKVMGLAPYGRPVYRTQFEQLITIQPDGSFRLNLDYFQFHYGMEMFSPKLEELLGPRRPPNGELTPHYCNVAATLQAVLEDAMLSMAKHLHDLTGQEALCMAGGVALNSVANGRILRETPFRDLFIQPAAGDGGTSLGVAAYIYNTVLGHPRTFVLENAYLGPGFSDEEIEAFLRSQGADYMRYDRDQLVKAVAQLIADDQIVGWFQGRMEFGPRALGNRSILANPCNAAMKDILNARVKHRESFRPFAPSVPLDDMATYFDWDYPSPFMLLVCDVRPQMRPVIPAITHVDGTARLQTVTRDENPLYYDLIKEVGRRTGVPVVLNTSFNIRGEPIVCTPQEAYACFASTDMDYLALGSYLIAKNRVTPMPLSAVRAEALALD